MAVAGAALLTTSALPFVTANILASAAAASAFVCAGPDHLDPLDPWTLEGKLKQNDRIDKIKLEGDKTGRKGARFEEGAENS